MRFDYRKTILSAALVTALSATGCAVEGPGGRSQLKSMDEHFAVFAADGTRTVVDHGELETVRTRRQAIRLSRTCDTLFGKPDVENGLPFGASQPYCECEGIDFSPPEYSNDRAAELASLRWLNPMPALAFDPYNSAKPVVERPDAVCAVLFDSDDPGAYRLKTYDSEGEARVAGAQITHTGACGVCSSLENLAVYMANDDLTGPVRSCAFRSFVDTDQETVACIQETGFDYACAQMWFYNARNTRSECLRDCAFELNAEYHNADGSLNACIQCDEDMSGPVFRAAAGRTRRNSGLPSSLARPCRDVAPVFHTYTAEFSSFE